jgi:F-box protein 18 (helicase)
MIQLTPEQNSIVDCDLSPGEALKIIAFAGTGKTSTLIAYAKARPRMRFLYVAFNKSVQLEAAAKFPQNVVSRTSHALAFHTHGYKHRDRIVPGFKANMVMDALHLNNYEDARFTMDTLHNYLISADPKVSKRHVPYPAIAFYDQQKKTPPDLIGWANRLGRLMCDGSDETIGMLHDGYLKLYQLSNPVLNFDCILLDEAQDINPVTSAFVLSQTSTRGGRAPASMIIVGDSHQQIYSFRGATDTLKKIKTSKTLYLTQSFRFNNNIARVANMILQSFKHGKNPIVGRPFHRSAKPAWNPKGYTIIARTNAGVFDQAARLYKNNRLGFIGGIQGYRLNIIKDVYRLYKGTHEHIFDNYIKRFTTYTDLKSYAAAVEDIELLSVCKLVENYKASIPGLVDRINEKAVETSAAEIILTTAHKSKGLEWDNVLVMDDFPDLVENDAPINPAGLEPDEFNLIYVAVTRAIHNLRFQQNSSISAFIKVMQGEGLRTKAED